MASSGIIAAALGFPWAPVAAHTTEGPVCGGVVQCRGMDKSTVELARKGARAGGKETADGGKGDHYEKQASRFCQDRDRRTAAGRAAGKLAGCSLYLLTYAGGAGSSW